MRKKSKNSSSEAHHEKPSAKTNGNGSKFHLEFLHPSQKMAWSGFQQHDVLFLIGPAGCGKTHLATAFAINEVLQRRKEKIVLTRPIVEAGESLGYLPGDLNEKVDPYMMPLYDCMKKLGGDNPTQREIIKASVEVAPLAYMRGRSLINSEKIITPNGLIPIGDIRVGDFVIGSNGKPTEVVGVYPQGKLPTVKITFSDRTTSICSLDHLWPTMTLNEKRHAKGYTIKNTKCLMETVRDKHNRKVHRVPLVSGAVEFNHQKVGIDPYLLGVLLGDGHISKGFSITSADIEIIDECIKTLPEGHKVVYKGNYDYRIQSNRKNNLLKKELQKLELWGKKAQNKFVPDIFKYNTKECRLAILQGLMDTDGWICKHRSGNCRIQFCTTSKKLSDDIVFLVRSLGGLAYCRKREYSAKDDHIRNGKIIRHTCCSYVIDMMLSVNPFRLKRKADLYENNQTMTKMISSIEPYEIADCTCIQVAAEDHLFLTNDCIVTHNTFDDSVCIFDEAQNATKAQLKLFLTRFGKNSKVIITGDPLQSDLHTSDVPLVDVMRRLETLPGIGIVAFKKDAIVRHSLVSNILERLEE